MKDEAFVKTFKAVMIFMVVLGVVIFIIAQSLTGGFYAKKGKGDSAVGDAAIEKRIAPVAQVSVAGDKPQASSGAAELSGKDVFTAACFACHGTGAAGAPKIGDKAAWLARIAQGNAKLYDHAIAGFQGGSGVMPAKGGRADLSDAAVKAAVDYMVSGSK